MRAFLRAVFWLSVGLPLFLSAQTSCKDLIPTCRDAYMENFGWDGRYWRAELYGGETSEIYYTFFRGIRYRLIPCGSSSTKAPLHIRLYNANRTLLLDTRQQGDRAYWDLELSTTQLLLIELYYPSGDGCAALLIGHRAPMEASTRQ